MTADQQRILQLRSELNHHNHAYYVLNAPEISDREFDMLLKELERLEAENPDMADPLSHSARGERPLGGVRADRAYLSDAFAGQHLQHRRRRRLVRPRALRSRRRGVHRGGRDEVRRHVDFAYLRARAPGACRDAWRRRARRHRHRKCENHPKHSPAAARRGMARLFRNPRRDSHALERFRAA